jgi:hypothetical protein
LGWGWVALTGFFAACGGASQPAKTPDSNATVMGASKSSPGYAEPPPASAPPADYAPPPSSAPPAPSPATAAPSAAEESGDRNAAPAAPDPHAGYARANVQLSEARRQLDIATGQRDCANACRALDSMERAAAQLCELARSNDERRTCKSAEDQVGAARDRVHSACGDCPKKSR